MNKESKIYVAGEKTPIGAAILRELQRQEYPNIINTYKSEPELMKPGDVDIFFNQNTPDYVFLAAGKSGGIALNQRYPAALIHENLIVACNIVDSAYRHGAKKLLYLASSCTYPKHSPQPMNVESLMSGPLEPTNQAYAVAKIAGITICQAYRQQYGANFISVIPANDFGPGDDFDLENAHVIGALIRKMHDAKENGAKSVEIWGTGTPKRDFIFVDDLAKACLFAMCAYDGLNPLNIGTGLEVSISELSELVKETVGYDGEIIFNTKKPDGAPIKLLDTNELKQMGWSSTTSFTNALQKTYEWFVNTRKEGV